MNGQIITKPGEIQCEKTLSARAFSVFCHVSPFCTYHLLDPRTHSFPLFSYEKRPSALRRDFGRSFPFLTRYRRRSRNVHGGIPSRMFHRRKNLWKRLFRRSRQSPNFLRGRVRRPFGNRKVRPRERFGNRSRPRSSRRKVLRYLPCLGRKEFRIGRPRREGLLRRRARRFFEDVRREILEILSPSLSAGVVGTKIQPPEGTESDSPFVEGSRRTLRLERFDLSGRGPMRLGRRKGRMDFVFQWKNLPRRKKSFFRPRSRYRARFERLRNLRRIPGPIGSAKTSRRISIPREWPTPRLRGR